MDSCSKVNSGNEFLDASEKSKKSPSLKNESQMVNFKSIDHNVPEISYQCSLGAGSISQDCKEKDEKEPIFKLRRLNYNENSKIDQDNLTKEHKKIQILFERDKNIFGEVNVKRNFSELDDPCSQNQKLEKEFLKPKKFNNFNLALFEKFAKNGNVERTESGLTNAEESPNSEKTKESVQSPSTNTSEPLNIGNIATLTSNNSTYAIDVEKLTSKINSDENNDLRKAFYSSLSQSETLHPDAHQKDLLLPELPTIVKIEEEGSKEGDFIYDLEIVSNKNEKENIKVTFQPGKQLVLPKNLVNPIDKSSREEFFKEQNFIIDFKSGYAPIDIQEQQEKEFTYKDHFIRKKQSGANLKRVCGVSYVKKSESQQLNVDHIFERLPPLVFQGSTGYTILDDYEPMMKDTLHQIISTCETEPLLVTLMDAEDENLMKDYLCYPEQRFELAEGKVWAVTKFEDLWEFFTDRIFVCIHFQYDSKQFIKKPHLNKLTKKDLIQALYESNIQLGLLCKKGPSGKRAFLKTFFDDYADSESDEEDLGIKEERTKSKKKRKESLEVKESKSTEKKVMRKPKSERKSSNERSPASEKSRENSRRKTRLQIKKENDFKIKQNTVESANKTEKVISPPNKHITQLTSNEVEEKKQTIFSSQKQTPEIINSNISSSLNLKTNSSSLPASNVTKTQFSYDFSTGNQINQNRINNYSSSNSHNPPHYPPHYMMPSISQTSSTQPFMQNPPLLNGQEIEFAMNDRVRVAQNNQNNNSVAYLQQQQQKMFTQLQNLQQVHFMNPSPLIDPNMLNYFINCGIQMLKAESHRQEMFNNMFNSYNTMMAPIFRLYGINSGAPSQGTISYPPSIATMASQPYSQFPTSYPQLMPTYQSMQQIYSQPVPQIQTVSAAPSMQYYNPVPRSQQNFIDLTDQREFQCGFALQNSYPQQHHFSSMGNHSSQVQTSAPNIINLVPNVPQDNHLSKQSINQTTVIVNINEAKKEDKQEEKIEEPIKISIKTRNQARQLIPKNPKLSEKKFSEDQTREKEYELSPIRIKEVDKNKKSSGRHDKIEKSKPEKKKSEVQPTRILSQRVCKATARLVNKLITQEESSNESSESVEEEYSDASDQEKDEMKVESPTESSVSSEMDEPSPKEENGVETENKHDRRIKLSKRDRKKLLKTFEAGDKTTINTLSVRVEIYLGEKSWKTASRHTKDLLYTFSAFMNEEFAKRFRYWTKCRMDLTKPENMSKIDEKCPNLYHFDARNFKYDVDIVKNQDLTAKNEGWAFSNKIKRLKDIQVTKEATDYRSGRNYPLAMLQDVDTGMRDLQKEFAPLTLPLYLITTRDSFAFDLIEKVTYFDYKDRKVKKTEYLFDPQSYPSNFDSFLKNFPNHEVGMVTYTDFFSHEELLAIEEKCYETERRFFSNHYLPMTGQMTCTNEKVRRTKFFFGSRYIWSRQQLSEIHSVVGAGIRSDVSEAPKWMKEMVEEPLVKEGIIPPDFINSIAMNVYHDGKEGLAQHFDDAVRFKQVYPVNEYQCSSLFLLSDFFLILVSRLEANFTDSVMELFQFHSLVDVLQLCQVLSRDKISFLEGSYAANGVKHCVRPCDMTGKSAALILRQMHEKVLSEAKRYDEFVEFPSWFSTLSIHPNAVSYDEQKKCEGEDALKLVKK